MICIGIQCNRQDGFSLIELLAAMVILCVGLLALGSCFGTTVTANTYTAQRADALRVAQEQMEAVKGRDFAAVISQTSQVQRNGVNFTCDIVANKRQDLKDVTVSVSWISRRVYGSAEGQVQLATVIVRR